MGGIVVFIPMYNCEKQIARVFDQFTPELFQFIQEVIVVDNRSTDRSREVAVECIKRLKRPGVSLLQNEANYNLGGSLKVAFNYALDKQYDYLLVLHGDDQADIRDMLPMLKEKAYAGADLYIGARFHPQSRVSGYSFLRTAGNRGFNILLGLITGRVIHDMIAGLNLYRLAVFRERWYLSLPDNLTFDAHMLLYALHKQFVVRYFPISWREDDQVSNARVFRQGWILLKLFFRYLANRQKVFADVGTAPAKAYHSQLVYAYEG